MERLKKKGRGVVGAFRGALAVLGACAILTTGLVEASAEVIDRIVAQINGEIITLYELEEAALPFIVQEGRSPAALNRPGQREQLLGEVLEGMIDRILVRQEAKEQGIIVSSREVDAWLAETMAQQGVTEAQFRQMIGQYGITFEDYRQIIEDNLIQMRVMQMRARGAAVPEAEVESIYRRRYGGEEAERFVEFRQILLVPDESRGGLQGAMQAAQELRERIEAGESFEDLAAAESQGPGAAQGGYMGEFRRGQLEQSFEELVFSLPEGVLSGPVESAFGVHLIEILNVEERVSDEVERRKAEIRARLQQREMERQMDSFLKTLRTRAFIDVRY